MLLKPVLPVFDYIVNYDYIANELCENKAEPELKCNGKCHLMKELAKASEEETPISEKKSLHHETEVLFYQPVFAFTFKSDFSATDYVQSTAYANFYSHLAVVSVFHPPIFI
ncbi:hypothetical protein DVK85_00910 [Flavobacterium arcticum]|uniref:Uncharacterized protein n=1 Tax=Flavobacterium arcticum TaxID=1784713 RepID=A0A345HF31_9FLAO|nr:hypothetical protein DVK85_00910 [Flavobacterium arcticum]KAF2510537.1 hypothetical protein E0W72_08295 [Flavobacterium arcticum]